MNALLPHKNSQKNIFYIFAYFVLTKKNLWCIIEAECETNMNGIGPFICSSHQSINRESAENTPPVRAGRFKAAGFADFVRDKRR